MKLAAPVCAALAAVLAAAPARAALVVVPLEPAPLFYGGYAMLPEHIVAGNQYYDLSVGGVEQLCRAQPDLCAAPEQQGELVRLQVHRRTGIILIATGIGAAVAGTIWSTVALADPDAGPAWRIPMAVGLLAGVALPVAGSIVMPSRGELVGFVNQANAAHPDAPMQIRLGGVGPRAAPGVSLSYRY